MTWGYVAPPDRLPAPRELGRLGPALAWLAAAQGSWPPHVPREPRTVVLDSGAGLDAGRERADALVDAGADLLVVGATGDPVPGLVVAAALLRLEPVAAVGTAAGPAWAEQVVAVRTRLPAARPHLGDPVALLDAVGSSTVAELAGLLAQAAARRTPVVVDGSMPAIAAALVADRLAPGTHRWLLAATTPVTPAAARALSDLRLEPLLDLGIDRPEAATLALHLLVDAVGLTGA